MALSTSDPDTFAPPLNIVRRRLQRSRRLTALVAVLCLLTAAGWEGRRIYRWCGPGTGSNRYDGECVGLSDGSYTFGNGDLTQIGKMIKEENVRAAKQAGHDGRAYVRIALL